MSLLAAPPLPTDTPEASLSDRIVDATLRCIARWGVAKTTVDDVAREAGVGRATLYRQFPGGRDALFEAVVEVETRRFFTRLDGLIRGAASLEDLLVITVVEASTTLMHHDALHFLLAHEPEAILPHLAFGQGDLILGAMSTFAGPYLEPWLESTTGVAPTEAAARAAEWVARIVLSYLMAPSADVDLCDAGSARHLVRTYILPGLMAGSTRGQSNGS